MMFLEKYNNIGLIINLDHVVSMNWNNGLTTEFLMVNGETIKWEYKFEDEQMEDLTIIQQGLARKGQFLSAGDGLDDE